MPRTPEYQTMNKERHERKTDWLVIVRPQFLTGGDTKGLYPSITWIDREGGQRPLVSPPVKNWGLTITIQYAFLSCLDRKSVV